jgi:hypothetical protein
MWYLLPQNIKTEIKSAKITAFFLNIFRKKDN